MPMRIVVLIKVRAARLDKLIDNLVHPPASTYVRVGLAGAENIVVLLND